MWWHDISGRTNRTQSSVPSSRRRRTLKPGIACFEQLEPRPLLSSGPVALPDFRITHPGGHLHPTDTLSPTGFSPARIRHAYGIDQVMFGAIAGDGSGQTIGIVNAYNAPTITTDLRTFDQRFGLSDPPTFTVVGQTGGSRPGTDPSGRGNSWALETSLDVEWAHAVAPKASILLVEAHSDNDSDLFAAINTARRWAGVSVVSMSWGGSEYSGQSSYDSYFTTPAGHGGVTFIAASGDSGAYDYTRVSTKAVEYPASSPNVLGVGGTYLSADSVGNYLSESGWGNGSSSGTYGGSGGGISTVVRQPSWQKGVVTQSTTYRTVPDVAFDADPSSGVAVIDCLGRPDSAMVRGWRDEHGRSDVGRCDRHRQPGPRTQGPVIPRWPDRHAARNLLPALTRLSRYRQWKQRICRSGRI